MIEFMDAPQSARILVVGVGGGGCNAVKYIADSGAADLEFLCINTDKASLQNLGNLPSLCIGLDALKGLGEINKPELGREAALESVQRITEELRDFDLVFLVVGMGGGTGTGAAPVVAQVAKDIGILTVAVATMPFSFEGKSRVRVAKEGISTLARRVDSLIMIPNDKLPRTKTSTLLEAFQQANIAALNAVRGVSDLLTHPGLVNVDFADIHTILSQACLSRMGIGISQGENRARDATNMAVSSPMLEDISLQDATAILVNVTTSADPTLGEFALVGDKIAEFASDSTIVVIGTVIDTRMKSDFKVTVIVTGAEIHDSKRPVDKTIGMVRPNDKATTDVNKRDIEFLEIPAFLRRQADAPQDGFRTLLGKEIKLVAPTGMPDQVIVDVIQHLSNVYRSVGGDELLVDSVKNLPPSPFAVIEIDEPLKNRRVR